MDIILVTHGSVRMSSVLQNATFQNNIYYWIIILNFNVLLGGFVDINVVKMLFLLLIWIHKVTRKYKVPERKKTVI